MEVGQSPCVLRAALQLHRVYTLARLMDAAVDNLGRIRLVWARLWAALSAHLVSAACHPDARVSVLAVGHLRALAAKLLQRAELSCFTHQASLCAAPFGGSFRVEIRGGKPKSSMYGRSAWRTPLLNAL